jgi:hypothetical protein
VRSRLSVITGRAVKPRPVSLPATGMDIDLEAIGIVRFGDDGLAHEHWGLTDVMTMMQQLGVMPKDAPA